ncbi:MAG: PKD domain-containing protein, partial [Bacteroidota bacterium]
QQRGPPEPAGQPKTEQGTVQDSLTFNHFDRINLSGGQDTTLCLGDTSYCLIPNIGGGFWTFNGVADSAFCFDPIVPDTFLVFYQIDSFACTFFDTVQIIVSDPPIVDAGPDLSVCPDDTLALSPVSGGGVWSGPWLVNDSLIVADSAGVYTLYYCFSDTSSNCGNCDSLALTVFPRHSVEAGPDLSFCLANVNETLPTPSPTGGLWSGAGITNPTLGLFNPSLVGLGSHIVYYIDTNANGCVGQDSLTISVIPITPADAGEDTTLCRNGALFPLSGTGDWSSTAPGFIAPATFDPGVASGTFDLVYTLFGGTSCEDRDTLQIIVVDTAFVDAGPDLDVCVDTSSFNLSGASPAGGIWSGNGIIDPITGLFDPSLVPVNQSTNLSYTYTDPITDCQSVDTRVITVRPLPAVNAGPDTLYCLVPAAQSLPTPSPAGGLWSGPGLLNANTGLIDPLAIGVNVVNFVYTYQDGFQCRNTDTVQVTIASPDSASIGLSDTSICVNDLAFALATFSPIGGDWFGAGFVAPNTYDPAQAGVGVDTLVYCVGSNTCRTCDTVLINVQAIPTVNAGNYANVCQLSDSVLLDQGTPVGGVWTGPQVVQVGLDYYFLPLLTGITNLTYTYTDPITDCSNNASTTIEVDTLPVVMIAGDSTYCLTPLDQALPAVNLGPGQWSGPGLVNTTTGIFNPTTVGTGSFPFIYEFIDANGCSDRDTAIITVIEPDSVSAGVNDTVCINEGAFTIGGFFPAPPNGSWTGNGISDPSNGIYDPALAGVGLDTLIYCVGAGSCLVCDTISILVEAIPPVAALPDSMCISDPAISLDDNGLAFGAVVPGVWSGPFVTQVGANSYTFGPAPVGTYTVIFTYIDSINTQGCINADTTVVRVDSLPVAAIAPLANACVGDNINFTNLSTDAVNYLWDFGVTPVQTSTQFAPSFAYADTGTYTVSLIAISAVGCADTTTQALFISEPPVPLFSSSLDTACAMPTPIPGLIGVGVDFVDMSNAAGGTYFWDYGGGVDVAGNSSSSNFTIPTIYFAQGADDTTYTISLTIGNYCDTITYSRTITVRPLPQVLFGPNQSTGCSPFCVDFNNASLGNASAFAWYADGLLFSNDSIPPQQCYFYQGIGDTTYTIRLIAQNACGADTAEHIITVLPNDVDAFFNIDQTQGCAPFTVTVSNL